MKTVPLDDQPRALFDLADASKWEYVVFTRGGKPVAYVFSARHYDGEDIGYMTDPEFWKMIRERREEDGPAIPLEQIEAELRARELEAKPKKSRRTQPSAAGGKKDDSNGQRTARN